MAQRSVWRSLVPAVFVIACFVRAFAAPGARPLTDTAMREAFAAFTRGDLPGAERLFRQIVDRQPANRIARF